jgi:predicted RNase H-like nuclease (RuvC/YqgF family)
MKKIFSIFGGDSVPDEAKKKLTNFLDIEVKEYQPKKNELNKMKNELISLKIKSQNTIETKIEDLEIQLKQANYQYEQIDKNYEERKKNLEDNMKRLSLNIEELKNTKIKKINYSSLIKELEQKIGECDKQMKEVNKKKKSLIKDIDFDGLNFNTNVYEYFYNEKTYKISPSYKFKYGGKIMKEVLESYPNIPIDMFIKDKNIKISRGRKTGNKRKRPGELFIKSKKIKS